MPGEGATTSILQTFVEEVKKVKGKKEEDVIAMMKSQREPLSQIERAYQKLINDKYYDFRTLVALGEPEKETKYVNSFVSDIEALVKIIIEHIGKLPEEPLAGVPQQGSTRPYRKKFDKCVKSVRKSVKARKGSNKESAAIAICTKSVLQTRGRTMKKYRKGRLVTQKSFH